jgi:NADP-dependent 3-hydroxy acid dehydrogenase YdfG
VAIQHETALIAGGGSGIGRAISLALAQAGVRVSLVGRNREKLERTRGELGTAGETAHVAPCDVTNREQVIAMINSVLAAMGSIDILICSVGINVPQRSLRSLDPADWDRIINTNLTGSFNLVHGVLPAMRSRGTGLVIQIGSVSGMRANVLSGVAYSASKFGQAALGVCIGREERGRGIRSTVIYPGEVNTPFLEARGSRPGGGDENRRQSILQPEDIAAAVRFLAELPRHVHIPELVIKPTIDDFF